MINLKAFCTFVYDGDTIAIDPKTGYKWVRLASIDAPEISQQLGIESKRSLMAMCAKREVELNIITKDKYKRLIAQVLVDGMDASVYQVRMGMAFPYFLHDCNKGQIMMASAQARQARLGVWGIENLVLPAQFRIEKAIPVEIYKTSTAIPPANGKTISTVKGQVETMVAKTFTANSKAIEAVEEKPDEAIVDQLLLTNRKLFMPTLEGVVWVEQLLRL